MSSRTIPVDKDLNAIAQYDQDFPFLLSKDDLSDYPKGFVNWHKQPSIEIAVILEGALNVHVLEQERTVGVGSGFIIMPGCLHSFQAAPGYSTVRCFTMIFYPEILYGSQGSFFDNAYYRPFVNRNASLYIFHESDSWTHSIFQNFQWICDHYPDTSAAFRLRAQRILQDAWIAFCQNLTVPEDAVSGIRQSKKILDLINYLHSHYPEKFSLSALADSVCISRSECCRYFKQMMHMTITEYLLEFRLSKAAQLLEESDLSISEIAEKCGFCDVSYFIKVFRKKTGITPRQYARRSVSEQ